MNFKYQSGFNTLDVECPPPNYGYFQKDGFRFTSENVKHPENFISQKAQKIYGPLTIFVETSINI